MSLRDLSPEGLDHSTMYLVAGYVLGVTAVEAARSAFGLWVNPDAVAVTLAIPLAAVAINWFYA